MDQEKGAMVNVPKEEGDEDHTSCIQSNNLALSQILAAFSTSSEEGYGASAAPAPARTPPPHPNLLAGPGSSQGRLSSPRGSGIRQGG